MQSATSLASVSAPSSAPSAASSLAPSSASSTPPASASSPAPSSASSMPPASAPSSAPSSASSTPPASTSSSVSSLASVSVSSRISRNIVDFDTLIKQCARRWAAEHNTTVDWISYSTKELEKHIDKNQTTCTGKKIHRLFNDGHQLSLEVKEVPRVIESQNVDEKKVVEVVKDFTVDNASPVSYEKKDIQIKDTVNSAWKETHSITKTLEASAVVASISGLTSFQATLKGALTGISATESSLGVASEISISLSVTLPAASRNVLQIAREKSRVTRTVEARAAVLGFIVVCFNNKVRLPNKGRHKKHSLPLSKFIKKIEEYKIDHTGFDFMPNGEISFIQRETSESLKVISTTVNVIRSEPLPAALITQSREVTKTTDDKIMKELADVFRVITAKEGGAISIETKDPDKTTMDVIKTAADVTNSLVQSGFFGKERAHQAEYVTAVGAGSRIDIGKRKEEEQQQEEKKDEHLSSQASPAKKL